MTTATVPSATTARPEVFTRKASGLVRVMTPYSAFFYNILTMGVIFPWTYLWAPGALPGGKMVWGILLAMLIEIPIAMVYVWLSTALPRSGGDYVFQSRVWGGGVAFTIAMSGIVIWQFQWLALSGWLISYLGFAPLFLGLGATMGNASLSNLGLWFTQPTGLVITSLVNAALAVLLLASGFKNYVSFQRVITVGTAVAFFTTLIVLFVVNPATVPDKLNAFSAAAGGDPNFYQNAITAVTSAGINLKPSFSLLATLLVAPIAWTSLQWATYSAELNGEIKDAKNFKSQVFIMVGSLVATGILLALLAVGLEKAIGNEFLYVAGAGYWSLIGEANIAGFNLWPPILAVALTASPIIVLLIGAGYILNSFQIANNILTGTSRIMVAASLDRAMPEWFSRVHEKYHTPVNALVFFFVCSIPVILAYNLVSGWIALTLGVTFGCGIAFATSGIAGALFPYRAKEVFEASPGARYKTSGYVALLCAVIGGGGFIWISWVLAPQAFAASALLVWLVRLGSIAAVLLFLYPMRKQVAEWLQGKSVPWIVPLAFLGGGLGFAMVMAFLLAPSLGVLGNWIFEDFPRGIWAQIIALAIPVACLIWYVLTKRAQKRRGINLDYAFKEIPPE